MEDHNRVVQRLCGLVRIDELIVEGSGCGNAKVSHLLHDGNALGISKVGQNQRLVFAAEEGDFIFTAAENDGAFLTADRIDGAEHSLLGRVAHSQVGVFEVHRTAVGDIALEQQIPATFGADDIKSRIRARIEGQICSDLSETLDTDASVRSGELTAVAPFPKQLL